MNSGEPRVENQTKAANHRINELFICQSYFPANQNDDDTRIRMCLLFSYFVLLISAGGEDMNMNRRNCWDCWNCGQLVWKDISLFF